MGKIHTVHPGDTVIVSGFPQPKHLLSYKMLAAIVDPLPLVEEIEKAVEVDVVVDVDFEITDEDPLL